MTDNDYKIMELLMRNNQEQTKSIMKFILSRYYPIKDIIETEHFIYCKGNIDIALVAHLDTVAEMPRQNAELFWDKEKQVMFCPGYPGFDDKAGLYSIIKIIQNGLRPTLCLCCDEEKGGKGAQKLAEMNTRLSQLKYLIELDRAGYDDIVYYQCGNKQFQQYTQSFGFTKQSGSFSDISFISPLWDIASCNISCGYLNEHSEAEILCVEWMERTIDIVIKMLEDAKNVDFFNYQEIKNKNNTNCSTNSMFTKCDLCSGDVFEFETITYEGNKICYDCFEKLEMEEKV